MFDISHISEGPFNGLFEQDTSLLFYNPCKYFVFKELLKISTHFFFFYFTLRMNQLQAKLGTNNCVVYLFMFIYI